MGAEDNLYSTLSGAAGVTALVSTRIYPDAFPEDCARPAVAFSRAGTDPIVTIGGTVLGQDVTMQIMCWADKRSEADAVADAVVTACAAAGYSYTGRTSGYDEELGAHVATVDIVILI